MHELTLTRRSFVKAATVASAAAVLSSASLTGSLVEADQAWAEEAGERKMYVSTCHGCIQVCPCRVYVENNVVVKIEGHPIAPANLGSLCLKGLSQIHTVYSPYRVLYPLKRAGARGAENVAWERISWDEAIELASNKIFEAIKKYGTYSFFGTTGGGGGYSGLETPRTLATALGSPDSFEPGCAQCYLPRVASANLMYGNGQNQSIADCSFQEFHKGLSPYEAAKGVTQDTKVMVVWGAQPSVSQVAQSGRGIADLRAKGCKFVVVDPNMSPDAVKADVWLRVRPGSDAALALVWIRYIMENKLYDEEFCKTWTNLPFIIDPDTHLPYFANEIFPDFVQSTQENTPAYVCYDNKTQALVPFEYNDSSVDPELFWQGEVNGKECRSAGQIYKDAAAPWTLEKGEEVCWIPADVIEKGIRIYTDAEVAGIAHGVSSDMQQIASQLPIGLLALDMMMGYVNKPGAALTQHTRPTWKDGGWGSAQTKDKPGPRPSYKPNGTYFSLYNLGYEIGHSEAENAARIAKISDGPTDEKNTQASLWFMNQMFIDRLGMKNHKGIYHWMMSHIPSVLEAVKTGVPHKPRIWYECSGNKLAMLGNATSWYDIFPEIDFCMAQYPNITSFHAEVADLVFPLEEWLENPITNRNQLNYVFPETQIIHLGETVNTFVPASKVQRATANLLNEYMDAGNEIVFGAIGAVTGTSGIASQVSNSVGEEQQTSDNATALHPMEGREQYTLRFPIGDGLQGCNEEDSVILEEMSKRYGAPDYETFINDVSYQQPDLDNPEDERFVIPPEIFWQYDQHNWIAEDDGLPLGFGTESRKCEIYVTAHIKMAATGWPYCYPRAQEPVDASIGTEVSSVDPSYPYAGTYTPICWHVEPAESPIEGDPGYDPEYPLSLTSGRLYYFHHGTMRHAPFIRELYPVPDVRMHPNTAKKYGLKHMDWVEVTSRRASTKGRVYETTGMDERVIWMERFWNPECFDSSQTNKTGGWRECNVNILTKNSAPYNEIYGSYTNRGFQVNIKPTTKPENVWVEPQEFQPFMPNNDSQTVPGTGAAIELGQAPIVTFDDWK